GFDAGRADRPLQGLEDREHRHRPLGRGNFQPEGRDGRHLRPADRKPALRSGTPASRRSFAWTNRRRALMKISEVMTTEVQTVTPDQTAREAAGFMLRADAGSIPVCDGDTVS